VVEHAEPALRQKVTALLDEISRPLTPREIDAQLAPYYTRAKRKEIIKALNFLQPIILLRPERPMAEKSSWAGSGDGAAPPPRSGA
jgi:hypothetical protein